MNMTLPRGVDWSPVELPCAPRPINGELLSSWARRLAAANGIALTEICACAGDWLGTPNSAAICDYGAPKPWRFAMAALTRVPERWVWVLDLQQQFPAIGREWFLHHPAQPEQIVSGFCPDCFREQIAAHQPLHLKAAWAVALVTRCFEHQLPLYRYCPWCGHDQPVHFPSNTTVQCFYCGHALTLRRWVRSPATPEPWIAAFERTVVQVLAGGTPDPAWAGQLTARSFRGLLIDLIWMLTSPELVNPSCGRALVDRIVSERFVPNHPYGEDLEFPLYARCSSQREAVVCAMIQILLGCQGDCALGISAHAFRNTFEFRPFAEMLPAVQRNQSQLWMRIGRWPPEIQNRAGEALRFLESKRKPSRNRRGTTPPFPNPADKSWSFQSDGRADTAR